MTYLQAILLGLVQGATEFIPVSSSAHLVLIPALLEWDTPSLTFDVVLHFGTVIALIIYFWKDWLAFANAGLRWLRTRDSSDPEFRLLLFITLANIPAIIIGLLFEDFFEAMFHDAKLGAATLFLTAGLIWIGERLGNQSRSIEEVNFKDSMIIGLAQAVAIVPGISRSGSTIVAGRGLNLKREAAARFSFLMSAPLIFGTGVYKLLDIVQTGVSTSEAGVLVVGFLTALISGYLVIRWFLNYLRTRSMDIFAIYCFVFAALCLIVLTVRGG